MKFVRRLGPQVCWNTEGCPDILELDTGDFVIIGEDITSEASGRLPPGSACGKDERVIRIPRHVLLNAKCEIPDA